jgi:O-antigen/teichoic acid export membrane protein
MNSLFSKLSNKRVRQVLVLYSGTILQTILGFATSIILARSLKPEQYGNYSYLFNLISLFLLLVSSGHFVSTSMMLARTENETEKNSLLGASLVVTLFISCLFAAAIFVFSYFQDIFFKEKLGHAIRILSFALFLFPLQVYLENVFLGLNKMRSLAILRTMPKVLFLGALLLLIYFQKVSYLSAFVFMLLTSYIVYVAQTISIKPKFKKLKDMIGSMSRENKKYGFHVYVGSLFNVATTYLATISISYFYNNTDLGFYSLALSIATPMLLLPSSVAASFFKDFANIDRIPFSALKYTFMLSAAMYVVYVVVLKPAVVLLYSKDYMASVPLAYILGVAMIVHGFGDIFNRFLCAKAKGKEVRNGAIIAGIINVVAFLFLVPWLSNLGAAISRLIVSSAYCAAMYYNYRIQSSPYPQGTICK